MPAPSWEESNNEWAYGYLKFSDFQSAGWDVHVTFQTNDTVHVSIYELGSDKKKVPPGNLNMTIDPTGVSLNAQSFKTLSDNVDGFPDVQGYPSYQAFFLKYCSDKAVELKITSPKPVQVAPKKVVQAQPNNAFQVQAKKPAKTVNTSSKPTQKFVSSNPFAALGQ